MVSQIEYRCAHEECYRLGDFLLEIQNAGTRRVDPISDAGLLQRVARILKQYEAAIQKYGIAVVHKIDRLAMEMFEEKVEVRAGARDIATLIKRFSTEMSPRFATIDKEEQTAYIANIVETEAKKFRKKPPLSSVALEVIADIGKFQEDLWYRYFDNVRENFLVAARIDLVSKADSDSPNWDGIRGVSAAISMPEKLAVVPHQAAGIARSVGSAAAWQSHKVEKLKIVATIDKVTSKICRTMNGTILETGAVIDYYQNLLKSPNADEFVINDGWMRVDSAGGLYVQRRSGRVSVSPKDGARSLLANGICLPPYHAHCRTVAVSVFA